MWHRLLVAVFALGVGTAHAATFTVTSTADAGPGTLRDAVDLANAAPGADTINFAVTGTITLTTGAIRILDALTIQGPGAANLTIDGNQASRIFVTFEATSPPCPATTGPSDFLVTISGLTLRNGWRSVANSSGGAISSARSLVLDSVIVRDNAAKSGGAIGFWAQFPGQSLTIRDSQFIDNRARELVAGNTGAYQGGALIAADNCLGVRSPATVTIERSLFTGNRVQPGPLEGRAGAMAIYDNITATITDTRIVGNVVEPPSPLGGLAYPGGGINADTTSLTIERSEVADNCGGYGGGIFVNGSNAALQAPGQANVFRLINSTVSGNTGGAGRRRYLHLHQRRRADHQFDDHRQRGDDRRSRRNRREQAHDGHLGHADADASGVRFLRAAATMTSTSPPTPSPFRRSSSPATTRWSSAPAGTATSPSPARATCRTRIRCWRRWRSTAA